MVLSTRQATKVKASQSTKMQVSVHIDTEVLDPEVARRKANVWLLMNVGNLLRADYPELILEDEQLLWRYDVLLTRIDYGIVGTIGRIHVQAISGDVIEESKIALGFNTAAVALLRQQGLPVFTDSEVSHNNAENTVNNAPTIAPS